jgi:hypothetical protein
MINQLDIRVSSTNAFGAVYDTASMNGYVCLVGNFDRVNDFSTNSIAIINETTGNLDRTSNLAIALATLFTTGTILKRVLYTTSSGHPCLIFLTANPSTTAPNRCYVFFTDTLTGYDLLSSTPLTWSSPPTVQMNYSFYGNMKIDTSTNVLVVIGCFYISPFNGNGCAFIDIDSIFGGITNSSVLGVLGPAPANMNTSNYKDLEIDSTSSSLYLYTYPVTAAIPKTINVYTITNSSTPFTFHYSTNPVINGTSTSSLPLAGTQYGRGFMTVGSGKLYVGLSSGPMNIAIMNTSTHGWNSNNIYVLRNQAFGNTYPYGMQAVGAKLYIWGSFTNAFYPQPVGSYTQRVLDTNKRQGLAVFDITNITPSIIGEDLAISKGVTWLTYTPPPTYVPYEQSAFVFATYIGNDAIYLFPAISFSVYAVTSDHKTPTVIYATNYKNGIDYPVTPIKATLNGHDAQTLEANLLF